MTEEFIDALLIDSNLFQDAKDAFSKCAAQSMNKAEFEALVQRFHLQHRQPDSPHFGNSSTSSQSKRSSSSMKVNSERTEPSPVRAPEIAALFAKIDRFNHAAITWNDVIWFLTAEARSRVDSTRVEEDMRPYSFSRMRKGEPIKDKKYISQNAIDPMSYVAEYQRRFKTDSAGGGGGSGGGSGSNNTSTRGEFKETETKPHVPAYRYQRKDLSFIKYIDALPSNKEAFAVVTRGSPLSFYRKSTLELVKAMSERELNGARPDMIEYLPKPDVCITYSNDSHEIRCWAHLLSNMSATINLAPYTVLEGTILCLKTHAVRFPNTFFVGDSYGHVRQFEVPSRASDGLEIRLVKTFSDVHSRDNGGVSDLIVNDTSIFTTGFDHLLKKTDVRSGTMTVIGQTSEALVHMRYCVSLECVVAATAMSHVLCVWDATVDTLTEGKVLHRGHFYHHTCKVVGVSCVDDLFQAVSCDTAGEVRVWDLRTLRCVQSLRADGIVKNDNSPENVYDMSKKNLDDDGPAVVQGAKSREKLPFICCVYFNETHEIVTCTRDAIYCSQHNFLSHPKMCDLDVVQQAFYNYRGKTFLLLGSTRLSVWDSREGYRKMILDRALDAEVPPEEKDICACCLDAQSSRLFLAFSDGNIEIYAADSLEECLSQLTILTDDYVVEMLYSSHLQLLIGVTNGGALVLVCEDPANPFSFYQHMSTTHLMNLTISDALGRVAFADDERHLFYYETKIKNQRQTNYCEVTLSQQPRRLLFLGASTLLVSLHGEATFVFWRCSTSNEVGLEQLLIFDAFQETTLRHFVQFTNRFCGTGFQRTEVGNEPLSKNGRSAASSRRASRRSVASRSELMSSTLRGRPHTSDSATTTKESATNELLNTVRNSRATIVKKKQREVTCVAFDDRTHRLFVGDSKGIVNTYATCTLFQAFRVQRVDAVTGSSTVVEQDPLPLSAYRAARPLLINTAQPHGDSSIVLLRWVPETSILLSSGDDRSVALLSDQGEVADYLVLSRLPTTEKEDGKDYLPAFHVPAARQEEGVHHAAQEESKPLYCIHVSYLTEVLQKAMTATDPEENDKDELRPEESTQSATFTLTSRTRRAQTNKWPRRKEASVPLEASHAVDKENDSGEYNTTFSYTAYLEECKQHQQQQQQRSGPASSIRGAASTRAVSTEPPPLESVAQYSTSTRGVDFHEPAAPGYDCLQFSTSSSSQAATTGGTERELIMEMRKYCEGGPNASCMSASRTNDLLEDDPDKPFSKDKADTEIVNFGRIKDTTSRPFHMPLKALYASEVQAPYYPWMEGRTKETATFSLRDVVVAANRQANTVASTKPRPRPVTAQATPESETKNDHHTLESLMVVSGVGKPSSATTTTSNTTTTTTRARNNDKSFNATTGRLPLPAAPQRALYQRSVSTPRTTTPTTAGVYKGLNCRRTMTTSPPPLAKRAVGHQRDALFGCESLSGMVKEYDKELRRCLQGSHGKKKDSAL